MNFKGINYINVSYLGCMGFFSITIMNLHRWTNGSYLHSGSSERRFNDCLSIYTSL